MAHSKVHYCRTGVCGQRDAKWLSKSLILQSRTVHYVAKEVQYFSVKCSCALLCVAKEVLGIELCMSWSGLVGTTYIWSKSIKGFWQFYFDQNALTIWCVVKYSLKHWFGYKVHKKVLKTVVDPMLWYILHPAWFHIELRWNIDQPENSI